MADNTTQVFSLLIISGFLVLLNGIVFLTAADYAAAYDLIGLAAGNASAFGPLGIVLGVLLFICAVLARTPKRKPAAILAIIFSLLAFAAGGGFIFGAIIGAVTGIIILATKK